MEVLQYQYASASAEAVTHSELGLFGQVRARRQ